MPETSETSPDCLVEQDGHKLIVTMNRPERRNALSSEMLRIMEDAWDRVNSDPEIRVCILTGAGGYFCAGMDLSTANEKPPGDSFESGDFDPTILKGLLKGFRLTKPLIAAVEGPAIAGGTEILQGTDIRVAGESAKFGVAEADVEPLPAGRFGRTPAAPDPVHRRRRAAAHRPTDPRPRGEGARPDRPRRPRRQALAKAHELADMIAANGPLAVQAILKTMRDSEGKHEDDCWADDAKVGAAVFKSDDAKEGPRAFLEKRPAKFTGK